MSIRLGIKDIPAYLAEVPNAIIVNNLPCDSEVDRIHIERLTSTRYDKSDKISTVPSCGCGEEKLGVNMGVICESCGTEVTMNASNVQSELWLAAPHEIKGLILPAFAIMLNNALKIGKRYSGFSYLLNPTFRPPRGADAKTKQFKRLFSKVPRGINGLIDNIDEILTLIEIYNPTRGGKLRRFYNVHKDKVFPEYIPLPSRLTMLVEDTHVYTYYDKAIDKVLDAVYTVAGISELKDTRQLESKLASAIINLADYHVHVFDNVYGGKPGLTRKAFLGSRLSYSLRTIVTSIHGVHDYRYAKIPKNLAVLMFKPAILGKLRRQGMTPVEAYDYVKANVTKPTQRIVDILYELVEETADTMKEITGRDDCKGIVISLTRYPGLRKGSSQTFLVKEFSDDSIEQSILTLSSSNCDENLYMLSFIVYSIVAYIGNNVSSTL